MTDYLKIKWTESEDDMHNSSVHLPKYPGDAGLDLEVDRYVMVPPVTASVDNPVHSIPTGVKVCLPYGTAGIIMGRSSTTRAGLMVMNTVIDAGYTGDLFVMVINMTKHDVLLSPGTRIAQLVIINSPVATKFIELEHVKELPTTDRGSNGFGSSGGGLNG